MDNKDYIEKRVSREDMVNGVVAKLCGIEMTEQEKEGFTCFQNAVSGAYIDKKCPKKHSKSLSEESEEGNTPEETEESLIRKVLSTCDNPLTE